MGRFDLLTQHSKSPTLPVSSASNNVVPDPVPVPVLSSPLFKRRLIMRRYPVDPYEDQVAALDMLSGIEKEQGLTGSRAAMVRDALDMYLSLRPLFDAHKRRGFHGTITELFSEILGGYEKKQ